LGVLVIYAALGVWFGHGMPEGVHSWAQSDRLSIALNFVDNYSFFEPRTHSLMSDNGEVGVEFPLVQYVVAGLKKAMPGLNLTTTYRWITGLFLSFGLAWFVASFRLHRSISLPIYVLCLSPLAFFYQFNFLPDAAALGLLLTSLGFLNNYIRQASLLPGLLTVLFAALATLVKTSCGIYFISITSVFLIDLFFNAGRRLKGLIPAIGAIGLGLFIYWYDLIHFFQRNEELWSVVFLSKPLPVKSWDEVMAIWKNTRTWRFDYLSYIQYILGAIVISTIFIRRLKLPSIVRDHAFRTLIASMLGAIIYALLIGMQFSNHDYYFLCTFYPIFIWGILYGLRAISSTTQLNIEASKAVVYTLAVIHLAVSLDIAQNRRSEHYHVRDRVILNETKWLQGSAEFLLSSGVPKDAKVFVLCEFAPNTSLIYMDHKGKVFNHEEMSRSRSHIDYWQGRIKPDYFVIRNKWLDHIPEKQPHLTEISEIVAANDEFSIFKFQSP